MQKARKIAQLVRLSLEKPKDQKSTLQAMAVSTRKKRKKLDGREYERALLIHAHRKELDVPLDKWIVDGVFKPNHVSREPIEEEWKDSLFCQLHNYVQHAIVECWALHRLVHLKIKEGNLELT